MEALARDSDQSLRRARFLALKAQSLARLREYDESKHPRDESGKWTDGGGGGGGGSSSTGTDKPAAEAKPAAPGGSEAGGEKKKIEIADFAKDEIRLDPGTQSNPDKQKKFVDVWNSRIAEAPAEFRKEFLGGINASMGIRYEEGDDKFVVAGTLKDANGDGIGEYTRTIDFAQKKAISEYFKLDDSSQSAGIGKTVLAANIAMYQKLGLDKVQVHADIDVGGYAWAKYGYVPERGSWPNLRGDLDYEIDKLSSGGGSGDAAGSWDDLPSSNQSKIEGAWMRSTRSEFLDSEINNWRDGGQPLDDAKAAVAEDFNKGGTMDWAEHAIAGYRKSREEQGQSEIPFTDEQILNAVSLNYDTGGGDGRGDLEVQFVDHKLTNPTGHDPAQETLPGIPPVAPHERLTPEMRDGLTSVIDKAFDREAEHKADDIEPPDYLSDSVEEYQGEYWDQMDDREKYRWAEDNASDFLTVSGGVEGTGEMSADDAERLRKLTQSNDPKALWAIADSKYGKKLLLGTDWYGALNLKDKETMDRFNAYVGKAKAKPA